MEAGIGQSENFRKAIWKSNTNDQMGLNHGHECYRSYMAVFVLLDVTIQRDIILARTSSHSKPRSDKGQTIKTRLELSLLYFWGLSKELLVLFLRIRMCLQHSMDLVQASSLSDLARNIISDA